MTTRNIYKNHSCGKCGNKFAEKGALSRHRRRDICDKVSGLKCMKCKEPVHDPTTHQCQLTICKVCHKLVDLDREMRHTEVCLELWKKGKLCHKCFQRHGTRRDRREHEALCLEERRPVPEMELNWVKTANPPTPQSTGVTVSTPETDILSQAMMEVGSEPETWSENDITPNQQYQQVNHDQIPTQYIVTDVSETFSIEPLSLIGMEPETNYNIFQEEINSLQTENILLEENICDFDLSMFETQDDNQPLQDYSELTNPLQGNTPVDTHNSTQDTLPCEKTHTMPKRPNHLSESELFIFYTR